MTPSIKIENISKQYRLGLVPDQSYKMIENTSFEILKEILNFVLLMRVL